MSVAMRNENETALAVPRGFRPPFCPYEDCSAHDPRARRRGWRPVVKERRWIARPPHHVTRYTCPECRRSFSDSRFSLDYRCRHAGLAVVVFRLINEGQSMRQVSRSEQVSLGAVRGVVRRLGAQCLLLHLEVLREVDPLLLGRVQLDGFRTFAGSQHEPLDLNTLVLANGFFVDIDAASLRRSGSMTVVQRREREERERRLGRPDPRARERSVERILLRWLELLPEEVRPVVATDEEPAYARVIRRLERGVIHRTVSSRARREDRRHILWRTNHEHRLLRHARADHKRETLSFAKRLWGLLDRAWIHVAWRNLVKGVSERRRKDARTTPAMLLGIRSRPCRPERMFRRRRFPGIVGLPRELEPVYLGLARGRPREVVRPAARNSVF